MPISDRQREIIVGLLLGDGHLEKNGRYVRLKVDQSANHSDYVEWLYRELKNLVPSKPRLVEEKDKRTRKIYPRLRFSTYSIPDLENLRKVFYLGNRKKIPIAVSDMLKSTISLAVWFMDDGYRRNDCAAIRLNTDTFPMDEQGLLVRCLDDNFNIKARVHKKGKWLNIYIPKGAALRFCKLVKPYLLPSFRYKLL